VSTSPPLPKCVLDANFLINLIHAARLDLLAAVGSFKFVVPDEVVAEITEPSQQGQVQEALQKGYAQRESITAPAELSIYADLRGLMGKGEAACLALAQSRGWIIVSDEKGRFRREVISRLGPGRLITTPGFFVIAIRAGVMSVEEADQAKELLEQHRFSMKFQSFRELI
jgi:predicted nucleic acid-binding protein